MKDEVGAAFTITPPYVLRKRPMNRSSQLLQRAA
jgi:hypothetical protein